jgi:hypothetical protein
LKTCFLLLVMWILSDKSHTFLAYHDDGHLSISLTQQSFAETLIDSLGFISTSTSTFLTPYHLGYPIGLVVHENMPSSDRDVL